MDRPSVSVKPPGLITSDWTVTYTYYEGSKLSSAKAVVEGDVVNFTCKVDGKPSEDSSNSIPGDVKITSQSTNGNVHVVKIRYSGQDLQDYF